MISDGISSLRCRIAICGKDVASKKLWDNLKNKKSAVDLFCQYTADALAQLKDYDLIAFKETHHTRSHLIESYVSNGYKCGKSSGAHPVSLNCYEAGCASMRVLVDGTEEVDLSHAYLRLQEKDRKSRVLTWNAIQQAFQSKADSLGRCLIQIVRWHKNREVSFRAPDNRAAPMLATERRTGISEASLSGAVRAVCDDGDDEGGKARGWEVGRKALKLKARALHTSKTHPADLLAPFPLQLPSSPKQARTPTSMDLPRAMELIAQAMETWDSEAASFVRRLSSAQGILIPPPDLEGGRPCDPDPFAVIDYATRSARVYLPCFDGSTQSIVLLSHYVGHAYHLW